MDLLRNSRIDGSAGRRFHSLSEVRKSELSRKLYVYGVDNEDLFSSEWTPSGHEQVSEFTYNSIPVKSRSPLSSALYLVVGIGLLWAWWKR